MGWGGHSLKMSGRQLLRFGNEGVLKIFSQRISQSVSYLINHKADCRTAPATPGLSKIVVLNNNVALFFGLSLSVTNMYAVVIYFQIILLT